MRGVTFLRCHKKKTVRFDVYKDGKQVVTYYILYLKIKSIIHVLATPTTFNDPSRSI